MRVIECIQGSEQWDRLRARPTCSEFGSFITSVRGDYSKSASKYASKIIAKRLGLYVEPPPTYWQEWGIDNEPRAIESYERETGYQVSRVGFIIPDDTDAYGGSPDGIIGNEGIVEVKCPAPETLISYHAEDCLPAAYIPQCQGLLWVSGLEWLDWYAYHPGLRPLKIRVMPDLKYHGKLAAGMSRLLSEIDRLERRLLPEGRTL
jgi:hypothetical protein